MPIDVAALTDEQLLALLKSRDLADLVKATTPWMDAEETAAYLGVSVGTLRNWTSSKYVPFAKRGRVVRYHKSAIDKWLSRGACPGRTTLADVPE
jgi:excisionase family DNA binding protein